MSAASKVTTMRAAVAAHVRDGDTVVIEGFTHLICFAAGHEIIRQRRRDLTLCRLTPDVIYDQMIGAMRELQAKHPSIGDVRGKGLMIGVEFVKDRASREPAPELARALIDTAFEQGLLLLTCGKSTLRLAPPLVIDEQDIDIAVAIIDRALTSLT